MAKTATVKTTKAANPAAAKTAKADKPRPEAAKVKVEKKVEKVAPVKQGGMQQLLQLRAAIKRAKPRFARNQIRIRGRGYKKLADVWRRPTGLHSKIRQKFRGAMPHPCYGSPREVRGAHPSGLFEKIVHTPSELEDVDMKKFAVRIASCVGMKKRAVIVKRASELGLHVLNPALKIKAPQKAAAAAPEAKAAKEGTAPAAEKKETRGSK